MSHAEEETAAALDEKRRKKRQRAYYLRVVAFLFVVLVGWWGFHRIEQQEQLRCQDGDALRQVLTNQTLAFYDYLAGFAQPRPGEKRTAEEQKQADEFLEGLKKFRDEQLSLITPSQACANVDYDKPEPARPTKTVTESPTEEGKGNG